LKVFAPWLAPAHQPRPVIIFRIGIALLPQLLRLLPGARLDLLVVEILRQRGHVTHEAGTESSRSFRMAAFAAPVLFESLAVDLRRAKKNPACAGSSSLTERSILLLSFSFFSAPHCSGFLLANSLLLVFLPVFPQRNSFVFPSSSSVHHHHHPHEVDEDQATAVPESVGVNVINGLGGRSPKIYQDLHRTVMNP
jgi:hypothetical protein